jgi:hypothetical protein
MPYSYAKESDRCGVLSRASYRCSGSKRGIAAWQLHTDQVAPAQQTTKLLQNSNR